MARPLRIYLPGGWYHVTSRGNERKSIFRDDRDRAHFLELLSQSTQCFRLRLHAFVLMPNHYHLMVETPEANLSRAIQWVKRGRSSEIDTGTRAAMWRCTSVGSDAG